MQQVKALPLPETKQEREARLSTAMGVPGSSNAPTGVPSAAIPAPMDDDDDMHHGEDAMPDFELGDEDGNLPVRPPRLVINPARRCLAKHPYQDTCASACHRLTRVTCVVFRSRRIGVLTVPAE